MRFRRLGRSGLKVSEVSYGSWLTEGRKDDRDRLLACVRAALDAGITTFHCIAASGTGAVEETVAQALNGHARDDLVLSGGAFWPEGPGVNRGGLSRKHLASSVNGSLRRLRTDYLDVFHLLRFDYQTPLEETFLALSDLVRQGKILYVGTAEWNSEQIMEATPIATAFQVPLVSNQPLYSMVWRVPEAQVFPACERLGIGQMACMVLAQGVLTGKYGCGDLPEDSRAAGGPAEREAIASALLPELLSRVDLLAGVAAAAGISLAQLAIAWVLQNALVATAVVGASRPAQIAENVKASGLSLSEDVLVQINELLSGAIQTDPRLNFAPPRHLTGQGPAY
jgi:aryl-alcohol dehydrogenase-like predicted oxidoreductase